MVENTELDLSLKELRILSNKLRKAVKEYLKLEMELIDYELAIKIAEYQKTISNAILEKYRFN